MEENFNMSAIEFIALSAVHSVVQARATLGTKWVIFKFIVDAQIFCSTFSLGTFGLGALTSATCTTR